MALSNFEQCEYWMELADDDLVVAKSLLKEKHLLHCGFFCHLVIEKALKAVITKNMHEQPDRIHDLQKLAKQGGLLDELSSQQLKLLDDLMPLHIEARYPEYKERIAQTLTYEICERILSETDDLLCWIKKKLEK